MKWNEIKIKDNQSMEKENVWLVLKHSKILVEFGRRKKTLIKLLEGGHKHKNK